MKTDNVLLTDWLLTDISEFFDKDEISEVAELINKGKDDAINVLFATALEEGNIWKENVGEIVMVKYENGEVYVKILFYRDRVDIYGIQVDKIQSPIPIPFNVVEYCA